MIYALEYLPESPSVNFLDDFVSVSNVISLNDIIQSAISIESVVVASIHAVASRIQYALEIPLIFGLGCPQVVHLRILRNLLPLILGEKLVHVW
jgi:hypothetical protein